MTTFIFGALDIIGMNVEDIILCVSVFRSQLYITSDQLVYLSTQMYVVSAYRE
jgi:hypothetical protein